MDRVISKGNHVDPQKMLVLDVVEDWNISPVLLKEMKGIKVYGWHKLRSVQKSIARQWYP